MWGCKFGVFTFYYIFLFKKKHTLKFQQNVINKI